MVDEIVTRQELIDAKRDALDLGKAVNEKVIVSPRYGEDFKSLPMIADEFEDAINTIVIDGGVPAVAVSDASGKTQQEVNNSLNGLSYAPDLPSNRRLQIIAGSVRNTGDGWKWISDPAHTPVGVTPTVSVSGLTVRIDYGFTAKRVVSLIASPDETFASMGITVGGSVGTTFTNLSIAAPLEFAVDINSGVVTAPAYRGSYITTSVVNGALVITHPKVSEGLNVACAKIGTTGVHSDIAMSVGTTQITLYGAGNIDGVLTWNSGQWSYSGDMRTAPSVSFSAGVVTLTHPDADLYSISVCPISGDNVKLTSRTGTTTVFTVYDATGAVASVPTAGTSFNFSRKANVAKNRRAGLYSFTRGYAVIDAANLSSGSGNIWIYGVMEV